MALVALSGVVDGVVAVVGCSLELAGLVDGVVTVAGFKLTKLRTYLCSFPTDSPVSIFTL